MTPEQKLAVLKSRNEAYYELLEDIEVALVNKDYEKALELSRKRGKEVEA